jgi:hypothetical protein
MIMRIRTLLAWLALFQCCVSPAFAQRIEAKTVNREVIEQRLAQISGKNAEREARLHELFVEAGCTNAELAAAEVSGSRLPNLVCTLPGSTDATIIVGAGFAPSRKDESLNLAARRFSRSKWRAVDCM